MSQSRLVIEPDVHLHSSKNMLLVILFVSSLFSGCLQESSSSSISVENELIWIRVEDDYTVHTLDTNAVLTVRDLYNGSLIFEQRLNGTLADRGAVPCDTWKYRPANLDDVTPGGEILEGVCLMVNGDYSQDGGLHLNICLVEQFYNYTEAPDGSHVNRDHMEVVLCEFVDFFYDELDGEMSLLERDQSEEIFAITYPTESGLFRAFSNNSIVNLDTGVPALVSGGTYGLIPPYPSNNGTYWYTTKCSEPDSNNPQLNVQATILDVEGHHERSLTILSGSCGGNYGTFWWYPVIVDRCLLTSGVAGYGPHITHRYYPTSCLAYNTYDWIERGNPYFSLKASWFWNRISSPCYHEFDGVNYQYNDAFWPEMDLVTTKDNSGVPMPFDFIILDSINESMRWTYDGTTTTYEGYPGQCSDIYSESVVVLYADGDKIRISSGNSDLLDGWDQSSRWGSARWGSVSPIAYLIGLLAVSTVFSSNVNSYVANTSDKYSKKKDMGEKIRSLHYSQWESRDGPSVNFGEGLIGVVGGLLILSLYSVYFVLVVTFYLALAYLTVVGVVLLAIGNLFGLCCFAPLLFLGALLG